MDWSQYGFLAVTLVGALALLALVVRLVPGLTSESRRHTRSELVVLGLVVALGLAIVYGAFLDGSRMFAYHDVGSDTIEQYVPYYLNLLDRVREGTLGLWNFDYGLGTSFMSYQSWTLDPFNLVLVPLGLLLGNAHLGLVLVIVQCLKVLACAFLFDHLLVRYCRTPLARVLGAATFSFCGYLMLWGQHYWLGTVIVMAVLLTVLLEALMERSSVPRFLGVMATVALTVMMSTYSGFMVLLYAFVYALLKLAVAPGCQTPGGYLRGFGRLALPVVCGLLVSMVTLVPYATLLLGDSSRVTGGDSSMLSRASGYLTDFVPLRWLPFLASRLLGNGLVSAGADLPATLVPPTDAFQYVNVYECVQLGFGALVIVLLGQFAHWVAREASAREKVLVAIATLLCLLYCVNFFLPALTNVFVDPKYRSCFALAVPVCIAMAVGFERRVVLGKVALVPLAASYALTLAIIVWSLANTVDGRLSCLAFLVAALAGAACLLVCRSDAHRTSSATSALRPIALALLCACAVGSSVEDGFFVTNLRGAVAPEDFPEATQPSRADGTEQALAWIRENDSSGFYRIEKLYTDWSSLNDSLVQGYAGVASYNSTLDSDVADFYRQMWPGMLDGDSAYQRLTNDPNRPALLRMLGVKYLLAHDELPFDWCQQVAEFGSVRVYQVTDAYSIATVKVGTISESEADAMTPDSREQLLSACAIVPDDAAAEVQTLAATSTGTVPMENEVLGPNGPITYEPSPASLSLTGTSSLKGTVKALTNGSVACLAIPNTAGWEVTVDGQPVETFRANYGFIGFAVSAGEHQVEAHFVPRNLTIGIAAAAIGLLGGIASCLVIARRK